MNEPSVFDSSELTLPRDSLHFLPAALARPLAAADVDAADAAAIASADAAAAALEAEAPDMPFDPVELPPLTPPLDAADSVAPNASAAAAAAAEPGGASSSGGRWVEHRLVHNLYGALQAESTYGGLSRRRGGTSGRSFSRAPSSLGHSVGAPCGPATTPPRGRTCSYLWR